LSKPYKRVIVYNIDPRREKGAFGDADESAKFFIKSAAKIPIPGNSVWFFAAILVIKSV
jgi:hypothetical protein